MASPNQSEAVVTIGADQSLRALAFERLIPRLDQAFAVGANVPQRHHHYLPQPDGTTGVLLLMPAWQSQYLGVKVVTIYPGNTQRMLPGVHASYLLSDSVTGKPFALIDGNQITARRTAATAALAASYLSREDSSSLLVVGAGRVASLLASAFRQVRPIRTVAVWDIDAGMAERLVGALKRDGFEASVAPVLEGAVRAADIVSCATLSATPLITGGWLKPGAHLDLIGSFTPQMREADDECFSRARVYVDTMAATEEAGDLIGPIQSGALKRAAIGTLAELCAGKTISRRADNEITIFKAVGTALADLAAGSLVYETVNESGV